MRQTVNLLTSDIHSYKGVQGAKSPAGARGVLACFSLLKAGRRPARGIMSGSQGLERRNCSWHPLRARKSGGLPPGCCALVGTVLTGYYLMATAAPNIGFTTLLKKKNFFRLWLAPLLSPTILMSCN